MILATTPRPVDGVDAANRAWGATCGPVAIAAALVAWCDNVWGCKATRHHCWQRERPA